MIVDTGYITVLVFGWIVSTLLAAAAVALVFFFPLQRLVSRWLNGSTAAFQHALAGMAEQATTLHERLPPSVFLKPIGDEAALALTWTSAMAALMQGASSLLFRSLQRVRNPWTNMPRPLRIVAGLVLTTAWSMGTVWILVTAWGPQSLASALVNETLDFGYFDSGGLLKPIFSVSVLWALLASAIFVVMVCASVVVLLVALLAAVGAGMPSLRTALYMSMSVEAIPAGSHRFVMVDVSSPSGSVQLAPGRLSHSALYSSPGAIRSVIEALEGFETARSARGSRQHQALT